MELDNLQIFLPLETNSLYKLHKILILGRSLNECIFNYMLLKAYRFVFLSKFR